jgi:hypothetical protein
VLDTLFAALALWAASGIAFWIYRTVCNVFEQSSIYIYIGDVTFGASMLPVSIIGGPIFWYIDAKSYDDDY